MTGTVVPSDVLSHDGEPGLVRTGLGASQVDALLDFTAMGGNALPQLHFDLEGRADDCACRRLLALSPGSGRRCQRIYRWKAVVRHRRVQGGLHGDILQANQSERRPHYGWP